ncbi:SusC/RagA family TonB-linked outer membrane protein [Pseudobacter ginsenosidimutans]|nr:SusC/RagA family TonB-linked outer membrane protein [Pseudobacter ginsenosidimutans]
MQKSLHGYRPAWRRRRYLTKTLMVMKLTIVLLIAFVFHAGAKGLAQNVTYSGNNVPLETVFTEVEKQTGYFFLYTKQTLLNTQPVSFSVKEMPLPDFLKKIFEHQPLTYTIASKTITITPTLEAIPEKLQVTVKIPVIIPPVTISGRIADMNGAALSGASVTVKGTSKGVSAGTDGRFILSNIPDDALIVVSAIGYQTIHVRILNNSLNRVGENGKAEVIGNGGLTDQLILLKRGTSQLDETVVIAYGSTTRRMATGSIGTIKGEDISRTPVANLQEAMQGRIPGVNVIFNNGKPNSPVKIQIRGRNSLNPNSYTDPLYVLDGIPLNPLSHQETMGYLTPGYTSGPMQAGLNYNGGENLLAFVNPKDVESIDFLKDADATALYGARAANGVILITTKRGKPGPTRVDVDANFGIVTPTRKIKLMGTADYLAVRREAFKNDGITPTLDNAIDLVKWDPNRQVDWQDFLLGTGKSQTYNLNVSGGVGHTNYRFSANYTETDQLLNFSGKSKGGGLSANITHRSTNQKLQLAFNSILGLTDNTTYGVGTDAIFLPPNAPDAFTKEGNANFSEWRTTFTTVYPFAGLFLSNPSQTATFTSNLSASYELLRGLSVSMSGGHIFYDNDNSSFRPLASQDPAFTRISMAYFGKTTGKTININGGLRYKRYVGKGTMDIGLTAEYVKQTSKAVASYGLGYPNDNMMKNINNAMIRNVGLSFAEARSIGLLASLRYDYENKYILNVNLRRDGSSKFAPGRQFGNFGSVSGSWILSNEKWLDRILPKWVSSLKMLTTYGTTGSSSTGDYEYLSRWTILAGNGERFPDYENLPAMRINQPVNQQYQWESTSQVNYGAELALLKDALVLNVTHYRKLSGNQLLEIPTPEYTGFISALGNLDALVLNTGWEFSLSGRISVSKDLSIGFSLNMDIQRNKLKEYPNLEESPYAQTYVVGRSISNQYLLHYTGIDPFSGNPTFEDRSKDGYIAQYDRYPLLDSRSDLSVVINTDDAKYQGGLQLVVNWKDLQFSTGMTFRNQIGAIPYLSGVMGEMKNFYLPDSEKNKVWRKPGDIASYPRFTTNPVNEITRSDGYYANASYIKFNQLSVSYSFPYRWLNKVHLKDCRIKFAVNNLGYITPYKGLDPETQMSLYAGPVQRQFSTGIGIGL